MKAIVLKKLGPLDQAHLELVDVPFPEPAANQILVKVLTCGICHTELEEIEGRLPPPALPIILGHEIVGRVDRIGLHVTRFKPGDRVGIAWIHGACGTCSFCKTDRENLCPDFQGTGYQAHGGYAEYTAVSENFAYPIPELFSDAEAAPLLCAGAIGYRAVKLTGLYDGQVLGLFGFGASAHLALQVVKHRFPQTKVFVFTRAGQPEHQELARRLGADWIGVTGQMPPAPLNAAIDFTPAWEPVAAALRVLDKGGRLVINAIRKEERDKKALLNLDYARDLWQEKELKSVANITRADAAEFLRIAAEIPIRPQVQEFPLARIGEALQLLKQGKIRGAGVLRIANR